MQDEKKQQQDDQTQMGYDEEMSLVCLIKKMQSHGFVPNQKDVCCLAYELVEAFRLAHKKRQAAHDWYTRFLRRHPELNMVEEASSEYTKKYFALLEIVLAEHNLFDKPANIFSQAVECLRKYSSNTSQGNGSIMSLIACSNALGQFLPPVCVLKAQSNVAKYEVNTPPGTVVFLKSGSALVGSERFLMWLRDHFAPRKPTGKSVILLDARSTYCFSFKIWDFAMHNDIILLGLPSSKVLQPLSEEFSRTLMTILYSACKPYIRLKNELSQTTLSKIQTEAWTKATNAEKAKSRFATAGIYPYVPHQNIILASNSKDAVNMILQNKDDKSESRGSQQRLRKILTLEERVRIIKAYNRQPKYNKVANMFNCSWVQIMNIINNRKTILDFYEVSKGSEPKLSADAKSINRRKIALLVDCMNEYLQRVRFYAKTLPTEEDINAKAIEFRELIQIQNFRITKLWRDQFKVSFDVSVSQRQIFQTRLPPTSLDLKDIMTYCSCNKELQHKGQEQIKRPLSKLITRKGQLSKQKTAIAQDKRQEYIEEIVMRDTSAYYTISNEMKQQRQLKINFLEKALYEYIQRSQYHYKMPLTEEYLTKIAYDLNAMLKIDQFFPNKRWLNLFKFHYNFTTSQRTIVVTRTPPFSLDLKDILSYCSRMDQNNADASPTTLHRDNIQVAQAAPMAVLPEGQQQPQVLTLKIEEDAKIPNATEIKNEPAAQTAHSEESESPHTRETEQRLLPEPPLPERTSNTVSEPCIASVPSTTTMPILKPQLKAVLVPKEEPVSDDDEVLPSPLKIQKIETLHEFNNSEQGRSVYSVGHRSEASSDDEDQPKHAKSYAEALRVLKSLEDFAMLEENYRAIGLLTQLENIFKNPSKPES